VLELLEPRLFTQVINTDAETRVEWILANDLTLRKDTSQYLRASQTCLQT
jgi:hypothetical protein